MPPRSPEAAFFFLLFPLKNPCPHFNRGLGIFGKKPIKLVCKLLSDDQMIPAYFNAASASLSRCMAFSRFSSELA